jgi:hypothetical protein
MLWTFRKCRMGGLTMPRWVKAVCAILLLGAALRGFHEYTEHYAPHLTEWLNEKNDETNKALMAYEPWQILADCAEEFDRIVPPDETAKTLRPTIQAFFSVIVRTGTGDLHPSCLRSLP